MYENGNVFEYIHTTVTVHHCSLDVLSIRNYDVYVLYIYVIHTLMLTI